MKVLVLFVSIFFLCSFITCAVATDRVSGVAVGDWFKYGDFKAYLTSNDPNPDPLFRYPSSLSFLNEANETNWMMVSVENVSYLNPFPNVMISLNKTKHFWNGSETVESGFVDVYAGLGVMMFQIVSADLGVNDSVYIGIHSDYRIDETVNRSYLDGDREVNHMRMASNMTVTRFLDSESINGTSAEAIDYYWDRATGVLVEYCYFASEEIGNWSSSWHMSYILIESDTWIVSEFPLFVILPILMCLTTLAVTVCRKRGNACPIYRVFHDLIE